MTQIDEIVELVKSEKTLDKNDQMRLAASILSDYRIDYKWINDKRIEIHDEEKGRFRYLNNLWGGISLN